MESGLATTSAISLKTLWCISLRSYRPVNVQGPQMILNVIFSYKGDFTPAVPALRFPGLRDVGIEIAMDENLLSTTHFLKCLNCTDHEWTMQHPHSIYGNKLLFIWKHRLVFSSNCWRFPTYVETQWWYIMLWFWPCPSIYLQDKQAFSGSLQTFKAWDSFQALNLFISRPRRRPWICKATMINRLCFISWCTICKIQQGVGFFPSYAHCFVIITQCSEGRDSILSVV